MAGLYFLLNVGGNFERCGCVATDKTLLNKDDKPRKSSPLMSERNGQCKNPAYSAKTRYLVRCPGSVSSTDTRLCVSTLHAPFVFPDDRCQLGWLCNHTCVLS